MKKEHVAIAIVALAMAGIVAWTYTIAQDCAEKTEWWCFLL